MRRFCSLTMGHKGLTKNVLFQDSLTRSLRISPYGPQPSDGSFMDHDVGPGGYILRPGTAPPIFRNTKVCQLFLSKCPQWSNAACMCNKIRARNNGRSTDNVQTDWRVDWSTFRLAGHVVRSHSIVLKMK